ncbi:MAG: glycosyltransferase [Muribaculaceae bacterium]|nr:glycosyltransferase [Muribaculaceae bacterium]
MKIKVVYILVCDEHSKYVKQASWSMFSLRYYNPQAQITLVTDKTTAKILSGDSLSKYVDELIIKDIPTNYSTTEKSRYLKTSLRQIINGKFIFLDTDTIVWGPIQELYDKDIEIGAVLNKHELLADRPSKVVQNYEATTGNVIDASMPYFNSGVMLLDDTSRVHQFFEEWHQRWCEDNRVYRLHEDQPSLALTNEKHHYLIKELDGKYNCQVKCKSSEKYITDSIVAHYYATADKKCAINSDYINNSPQSEQSLLDIKARVIKGFNLKNKRKMSLDILIPTFNRREQLIKNLTHLSTIIRQIDYDIRIKISDNCSDDGTYEAVIDFIECNPDIIIKIRKNDINVGLQKNLFLILELCDAEYAMIQSDDDYCQLDYLRNAINEIKNDNEIACIIPSHIKIERASEDVREKLSYRDDSLVSTLSSPGFDNLLNNNWRANLITGIIFKSEGLFDSVVSRNIDNMYIHIYYVGFNCLRGKTLYLPEYPVLASRDNVRFWNYDSTGYLNDIYQNYKALQLSQYKRFRLENEMNKRQFWRIGGLNHSGAQIFKCMVLLSHGPNTSFYGRLLHPIFNICRLFYRKNHKFRKKYKRFAHEISCFADVVKRKLHI